MGTVARAVLENGGHVTGIIPDFLKSRERMLDEIQETIVVDDMHTRKRLMFERSDAFVALPGGIGTLEELVEQMTWAQLGQHSKPILLALGGGFLDAAPDAPRPHARPRLHPRGARPELPRGAGGGRSGRDAARGGERGPAPAAEAMVAERF